MEKYEPPKNCDKLLVPRFNQEIWAWHSSQANRNDLWLEHANGGKRFPRTWTAYWAYKLMPWPSWGMLTMAFRFVDEVIKPTLNREFGTICSSQIPVTSFIFGDDLPAQLNAIRASNRLGQTATKSNQGTSDQNMKRQRNDRDKPFLSKDYPNTSSPVQLLVRQEKTASDDREEIAGMTYYFTS